MSEGMFEPTERAGVFLGTNRGPVMAIRANSLKMAAALFLAMPAASVACYGNPDRGIELSYPFVTWWFFVAIGWGALRGVAEGQVVWRCMQGIGLYLLFLFLSGVNVLVAALPFVLVWACEVMLRVHQRENEPQPSWWIDCNRACLVFIVVSLVYSQVVVAPSAEHLVGYAIGYGDASYRHARQRFVALGPAALPVLVDRYIDPAAGQDEYTRKKGVFIAERITELDFEDSPEVFMAWWAKQPRDERPEGWLLR